MAKITKEQYIKWSNQAKSGFNLDLQYYVTWGEKTLTKKSLSRRRKRLAIQDRVLGRI